MKRLFPAALLLLTLSAQALPTLPTLPQATVDTTYSLPGGATFTPADSAAFATALTNAVLGDKIVLTAGVTYTGPFTLPNKASGSGWIYITSSAYASLPAPGTRVGIADGANMPKIVVAPASGAAIQTANTAHHYRFVGIELKPASTYVTNVVQLGNSDTAVGTLPHHIIFDRCYIHGDSATGSRRGVSMDGNFIAVIDSYVSDFKEVGADTQALFAFNGQGPFNISNNYLEAAGENLLFGGTDPTITNLVPSDITIQRNTLSKQLSWIGSTWSVKNILELKNARRVLVTGNILTNIWAAAQRGEAFVLTPRNQQGTATWSTLEDITIRYNKVSNVDNGFGVLGTDSDQISQKMNRVLIEHNLVLIQDVNAGAGAGHNGFSIATRNTPIPSSGPDNVTIRHNTILHLYSASGNPAFCFTDIDAAGTKADQLDVRDNIVTHAQYGWFASGDGGGTAALNTSFTNNTWTNNAVINSADLTSSYPSVTWFPADTSAVGFVNYAGGNYRLTASSLYHAGNARQASDSTDVGANINAIESAILGTTYHPVKFALLVTMTSSTPVSAGIPVPLYDTFDACDAGGKAKLNSLSNPVTMREGQSYSYKCLQVQGAANDLFYEKAA